MNRTFRLVIVFVLAMLAAYVLFSNMFTIVILAFVGWMTVTGKVTPFLARWVENAPAKRRRMANRALVIR